MANTQVIEKWIEALESGEYEQVTGRLKRNTSSGVVGHCCLGVLCEVAVKAKVIPASDSYKDFPGSETPYYSFLNSGTSLPPAVAVWAGLGGTDPILSEPTEGGQVGRQASVWNDEYGYDFHQIAGLIRNTYLETDDAAA